MERLSYIIVYSKGHSKLAFVKHNSEYDKTTSLAGVAKLIH